MNSVTKNCCFDKADKLEFLTALWFYCRIPVQTIFDNDQDGGVVAMAMTPDARYLATLSSGPTQVKLVNFFTNW